MSDHKDRRPPRHLVPNAVLAEALVDAKARQRLGLKRSAEDEPLPIGEDEPLPIVVELNLRHAEGLEGARRDFLALHRDAFEGRRPEPLFIATAYYRCTISVADARLLAERDEKAPPERRAVYRIWPDFPVEPLVDRSTPTVKADAAQRSYQATGSDITWAVIDSGIASAHPHFAAHQNLAGPVAALHRDFTLDEAGLETVASALTDGYGHGTHVAGIVAGDLSKGVPAGHVLLVGEHNAGPRSQPERVIKRAVAEGRYLAGVAPRCRLVSLKVLDDEGRGHSSNIIRALRYVREEVNGDRSGQLLRVQGVNLSVGYEFDANWFACGQSPMCVEVDRLVRSGVVVVVAAGNTGFGVLAASARGTSTGLALTINDPGNAELAITVGATHRDMPHTYGVSYFSSKGPTGDGRMKPDLVAPGERITSCAAGARLEGLCKSLDRDASGVAGYLDDTGTSMAAPHVSGAIAAFLSIRREFIGQPERVKRVFMESATPLGRVPSFEGRGLLDLMRAIQSV